MSTSYPQAGTISPPTRRNWLGLVILGLALAIVIIDTTIVNVTIPSIQKEFGASIRDLEWISASYALVYAAFIITWGRLADSLGRRLVFVLGLVVFVLGSLLVGVAGNIPWILVGRVAQGFGAAMTSPATLSILAATFTGKARGIAFGVWGATAGAAGALGPILGGWLTTNFDWRWAFLVNLPIGVIAIIGSFILLDESKGGEAGKGLRLDMVGIVLAALGLAALVFGLIEGQTYGWWTPKDQFTLGSFAWPEGALAITPVMFALSVVFLGAFVAWDLWLARRGRSPLFDFGLLRYRGFRFGLLTVLIVALGEFGVIFVFSIYYQSVRGLTAFDTGVALIPLAITSFIAAPTAGALSARFGPKVIVTTGMAIEAISIFLLGMVTNVDTPLWQFAPVFALYGVGVGLAIAQLTNVTLSDIPVQYSGVGSGANNTVRQVGAAIGIAVLGAILTGQITSTGKEMLAANTTIPAPIKIGIAQALDKGLAGEAYQTPTGPGGTGGDQQLGAAIKGIFDVAISKGVKDASTVASIFVLLGAISSLLIPNPRKEEKEVTQPSQVPANT